jgi:MoCo/4Fe-4S cofactor protein with predicted Tat translocation signal
MDLVSIREKLQGHAGKKFWRSLAELTGTRESLDFLHREFPYGSSPDAPGLTRRETLKLMAASAALAGLTACTKLPTEKIVPYAQAPPEEFVPGKPVFYATAIPWQGFATGLLVESHMGRPTKVEGNPAHPASLGATDIFAQASLLTLYDPDRAKVVSYNGRIGSWSKFLTVVEQHRRELASTKGAGLRVLTETITSPTLADQLRALLAQFPLAKWHQYEPCGRDSAREGSRLAFGEYLDAVYRFDQAQVILSLDSDFLSYGPGSVRYARDFADKRRMASEQSSMNRLYVVETAPSNTGAVADHHLPLRPSEIEAFARAVASRLGVKMPAASATALPPTAVPWIEPLVRELQNNRSSSVVIAGDQQSHVVHALAHAMNHALDNAGNTIIYTDSVEANPVDQIASLRELVSNIDAGRVDTLVILDGNPAFTAPADLEFRKHLLKVQERIHLSLYEDETAELCHWHIPEAHYLEAWSDARSHDGTASIIQPLIAPLYDGKSAHELLAVFLGQPDRAGYSIVRDYWQRQHLAPNFDPFWGQSLSDGLISGTASPAKSLKLSENFAESVSQNVAPGFGPAPATLKGGATLPASIPAGGSQGLEIAFRPDPTVWDGRFANNGWLQELPKPFTKLTWDNAALLGVTTALRLGVANGDVARLRYQGREVRAPIWIVPGHAEESVTVHLGYGRTRAGSVGNGVGFNAYALRTSDRPWTSAGLVAEKTGEKYELVSTQHHHLIDTEGKGAEEESVEAFRRDLIRVATIEEYRKNPSFAKEPLDQSTNGESLYPAYKYEGLAWGMTIDLNTCVGCNACVVACQSENNIPVVGKDQVARGREMHWIRVDTYYRGGLENPEAYNEPVPCMHCENAPCEYVCPVGATVHSPEGLNEMVYNRCVGTRYCSNNCPYKVRRFNFLLYQDWTTPSLFALRNPDVTVRSRGVMEKCTYCIQRINEVKIAAEKEDRQVREGEIQTACQQVCPSQAIVFGNINDPKSRVSKLKAQSRNYGLLTDLNTRPRTTYLARLRNPNPDIKE